MAHRKLDDGNCIRTEVDKELLASLRSRAVSNERLQSLAAYFLAAGNETRLRMLYVLHQAGELCVCDLADIFGISQPAVSRHLKILREQGLVAPRREAQTIYYSLYDGDPFARMLSVFFDERATAEIALDVNSNGISA